MTPYYFKRRIFAIKSRAVSFPTQNFKLEGVVYIPEGDGLFPAVVVCHPHPLYGGSMENNVVCALCEALVAKSIVALKFNFQGVGGSEGRLGVGPERMEDVRAAVAFVAALDEVDRFRIGIAGYSAGAAWGLAAVYQDTRVKALAAISPPLPLFDFNFLRLCPQPLLMISGSRDEHVKPQGFLQFCRNLSGPVAWDIVEGADHSWQGYESIAAKGVAGFFSREL